MSRRTMGIILTSAQRLLVLFAVIMVIIYWTGVIFK